MLVLKLHDELDEQRIALGPFVAMLVAMALRATMTINAEPVYCEPWSVLKTFALP